MNLHTKDLILRLKEGDIQAYESLFNLYYKSLCSFATQFVGIDDAEEIVQETMLWLWENREKITSEESLKALLYLMVKNKSINHTNKLKNRERIQKELTSGIESELDTLDKYDIKELEKAYRECLENLPPEFRETFLLNRDEQMTHKEISIRLNVSAQTVNYRISQTLKVLRKRLKEFYMLFL